MYGQRKDDSDFRSLSIIDSAGFEEPSEYYTDTLDYPAVENSSVEFGYDIQHPMTRGRKMPILKLNKRGTMGADWWSNLVDAGTNVFNDTAAQAAIEAEKAAKEAAARLAAQTAQTILARPDVSTALTTQAQQVAASTLANKILATPAAITSFATKNKNMLMIGGGVALLGVFYFFFLRKRK